MAQANTWDNTIPIPPSCDQLSDVLISSLSNTTKTNQLCKLFGINCLAVSSTLLFDPFLLSYNDLAEIESLYMSKKITSECFNRWFGFSVPFLNSPNINGTVKEAMFEFSKITVEIKKTISQELRPKLPHEIATLIRLLRVNSKWPDSRRFWERITNIYDLPNGDRTSLSIDLTTVLITIGQFNEPRHQVLKKRVKILLQQSFPGMRSTILIGYIITLWINTQRDDIWEIMQHFRCHTLPVDLYRKYSKKIDTVIKAMAVNHLGKRLHISELVGQINLGYFGGRVDQKSDVLNEIESRNVYPDSIKLLQGYNRRDDSWSCYQYIKSFSQQWKEICTEAAQYVTRTKVETVHEYMIRGQQSLSSGHAAGFTKEVELQGRQNITMRLNKRQAAESHNLEEMLVNSPSWLKHETSRLVEKFETGKARALYPSKMINVLAVDYTLGDFERALMRLPDYRGALAGASRFGKIHYIMRLMISHVANCLDYTDYNAQHLICTMSQVYRQMGQTYLSILQDPDNISYNRLMDLSIHLAHDLTVSYPNFDPAVFKTVQGLYSGLRHTGLTNTSQNMTDARVSSQAISDMFGTPLEMPEMRECQGDDVYRFNKSFLVAAANILYLIATGRELNRYKQLVTIGTTSFLSQMITSSGVYSQINGAISALIISPLESSQAIDPIARFASYQEQLSLLERRGASTKEMSEMRDMYRKNWFNWRVKVPNHSKDLQLLDDAIKNMKNPERVLIKPNHQSQTTTYILKLPNSLQNLPRQCNGPFQISPSSRTVYWTPTIQNHPNAKSVMLQLAPQFGRHLSSTWASSVANHIVPPDQVATVYNILATEAHSSNISAGIPPQLNAYCRNQHAVTLIQWIDSLPTEEEMKAYEIPLSPYPERRTIGSFQEQVPRPAINIYLGQVEDIPPQYNHILTTWSEVRLNARQWASADNKFLVYLIPTGKLVNLPEEVAPYVRVCLDSPRVGAHPHAHRTVLRERLKLSVKSHDVTYPTYNRIDKMCRNFRTYWIPPTSEHEWRVIQKISNTVMETLRLHTMTEFPQGTFDTDLHVALVIAGNASILGGVQFVQAFARAMGYTYIDALLHALSKTDDGDRFSEIICCAKRVMDNNLLEAILKGKLNYDRPVTLAIYTNSFCRLCLYLYI